MNKEKSEKIIKILFKSCFIIIKINNLALSHRKFYLLRLSINRNNFKHDLKKIIQLIIIINLADLIRCQK